MADVDINWLAVLFSAVAAMVIGFVWFSVLSEQWMAAAGRTREDIGEGPGAPLYAIVTALQLVTAVVLAIVVDWARADTFAEGLIVGFVAWLGFVASRKGIASLFESRGRNLYAIDAAHDLVVLLAMGLILAVWD